MNTEQLFVPSAKPVHLVKNFDDVPPKKRIYPLVVQQKHDGCYAFQVIKKGDYRIFSRTGKSEFKALKHLYEQAEQMHSKSDLSDVVLIFEVMADGMSAAAIAGRCQDETDLFPEAYVIVHDCIPFKDFAGGFCPIFYEDRYAVAYSIARRLGWRYSEWLRVDCEADARNFAQSIINKGGEGAVFKQPKGTWTAGKKNEVMMKIKQELSYDLTVVGVIRGSADGKYANTTGTIACKFRKFGKPDGEPCVVYCSGMSDQQRNDWYSRPDSIIGRIVQVDAMRFTEFGMLREPRFKGIRYDKEQADIV